MKKKCVPDEHCLALLSFWSASLSGLRNSQTDPKLSCSHGCTFSAPDCNSQAFWKAVKGTFYKELNVLDAWAPAILSYETRSAHSVVAVHGYMSFSRGELRR